ncbi:MAG: UDP-4-amino-4,6-dideoxy-N-acetyl-beta-L-altrosamine transaminase [Bacillaceae bacterium]|nr:UDP-4-amino-4,6-dideoxy-N-acetyl-beta-L-altrosamine transaminase [Bacillaceae bacterium]
MLLAIHGGEPVREDYLDYGKQWIDDDDIESVLKTLKSSMLTQGPMVEAFERKVANYVGAKYAVAFSNGTAALHGAYYAAGVGYGDEVITTPITFVATSNCALYLGAKPVFADIDTATYNLDPTRVEKLITERTKAIVPVDFTGQPADYEAFRKLADENNIVLIGDGAHSFGASFKGQRVGVQADMTMFSFHPVKPITTGEGGMIVTNSAEYYEKLRLFRSHGITKGNIRESEGPWYYEMVDLGMNYRMTDVQASLGFSQIDKLEMFIERRREIAARYTAAFSKEETLVTPVQFQSSSSGWHLYMLRLVLDQLTVDRKGIFEALRAENIGVHVHYIPVHTQPYYQQLGYQKGICPIAEKWYEEVITLPIFPKMNERDIDDVICAVLKVVNAFKK